jgi:hypothetical protein
MGELPPILPMNLIMLAQAHARQRQPRNRASTSRTAAAVALFRGLSPLITRAPLALASVG